MRWTSVLVFDAFYYVLFVVFVVIPSPSLLHHAPQAQYPQSQ